MTKRIFISADHGMAIIYFLQSDVIPSLLAAGVEVVLLTDDDIVDKIAPRPGLTVDRPAPETGQRLLPESRQPPPVAAGLPAARRRVVAHQRRGADQPHLGSLGREFVEVPFGGLAARRAGDSDPALEPRRPPGPGRAPRQNSPRTCIPIYSRSTSPTWSSLRPPAGGSTVTCCARPPRGASRP